MKKGLIPVTLGVAVTNQSKQRRFRSRDYANMTGALLVGAGVAHIALGAIDMLKE